MLQSKSSPELHKPDPGLRNQLLTCFGLFIPVQPRVRLDQEKRSSKWKTVQSAIYSSIRIKPARALGQRPVTDEIRSGPGSSPPADCGAILYTVWWSRSHSDQVVWFIHSALSGCYPLLTPSCIRVLTTDTCGDVSLTQTECQRCYLTRIRFRSCSSPLV